MPRNGSGIYSPPAGTAAVSLQPIASVPYNNYVNDISNEMTNSLPTTGVKAMGANLPMGGNQIKNMADGVVLTDGATMNNVNLTHGKVIAVQVLTTTGTYTRTAGATQGDIYVIGGGGAAGGSVATGGATLSMGSAGGGAGISIGLNVALPATAPYTIGAGGVGVSGANGGNGGVTNWNTSAIIANGGTGGGIVGPGTNFTSGLGVGATVGSGGTLQFGGQTGSLGIAFTASAVPGVGGAPFMWGFGRGADGSANGFSSAAKAGANGIQGAIIVVERS